MDALKLFIDTHDKDRGTFPDGLTEPQFADFFDQYQAACQAEGVVVMQVGVGLGDGRAFCLTLAPDAEAVRRAHQRVGLPFDSITEVRMAAPGNLFRPRKAA
ncbi:hypothetical protein A6A04_11860 [Paramagnetospirillum marisnigri]|uniref:DUF4242 domain-containing protein n=1 Tax=Paramagnetospirillum marisnigri TaxID=1285242 RepID=A0A178MW12_9PROT|nr:nickel-binding protein [Paramagnetospirillum marisnigri]OAN54616.1 hypothetical protein A6A04_11860 [Paramagnetospirillum marisnigri]